MNKWLTEHTLTDSRLAQDNQRPAQNQAAALRLLGLAVRAGKTAAGQDAAVRQIRLGRAMLLWLADDAAEATLKKLTRAAEVNHVPVLRSGGKAELGHWTGRAECAGVVVQDDNIAGAIRRLLEQE